MTYRQDKDLFESFKCDAWWCIEGSQKVLMSNGSLKMIRDISVGDSVWSVTDKGFHRKPAKVIAHHFTGIKPCVMVSLRGGLQLTCTPDHKIWGKKDGKEYKI